ncbi:MAG: adenylate/guanylate cyclase domain-containing protein [Lachnospiraceae bacterium]|nr:adenylate/guanylate cyclase domain-containing protein [Lachnospiraceae bacterium]
MKMKKLIRSLAATLCFALLTGLLFTLGPAAPFLNRADSGMVDMLYQHTGTSSDVIRIIGVDEDTLAEYGIYQEFSREKTAALIEKLNADPDKAPAVIVLDILFTTESNNKEADDALVSACKKYGNVITGENLLYGYIFDKATNSGGVGIKSVEEPFDALKNSTLSGFCNTTQDSDGYIRYTMLYANTDGVRHNSLAYETYLAYCRYIGSEAENLKTNSNGELYFYYTTTPDETAYNYEETGLNDVLKAESLGSRYKGKVVFVGATAAGMEDAYNVAIDRGVQMNGVEIHANILQALLEGKTAVPANGAIVAALAAVLIGLYVYFTRKLKLLPSILIGAGLMVIWPIAGLVMKAVGLTFPVFYFEISVILVILYLIITKYLIEKIRRQNTLHAFSKYVAPQVISALSKDSTFEIKLGGERRHIAVLFVDIRGFTTMSESLEPEQVVAILNQYLDLTSKSIFQNDGTLDKFVGDATMALFNAPVDLDDYIYKAVCAARDMAAGAAELEKKLEAEFGRSVGFGVGVNCGPAIVGNIGAERRMDYTAIGDTVNTAARLESVAKRGQILISQEVLDALGDRVVVEPVGELALKGKAKKIPTYNVLEVK